MNRFLLHLRKVLWHAFDDDVINTSKAVAYSGMLMIFPALMVIATLLAQSPEGPNLVGEFRSVLEQFMPADSMGLLPIYASYPQHPVRAIGLVRDLSQHLCRFGSHVVPDGGFSPRI